MGFPENTGLNICRPIKGATSPPGLKNPASALARPGESIVIGLDEVIINPPDSVISGVSSAASQVATK